MPNSLAYHVVVNALEGKAGWKPMSRFVSAVSHVISGHLPYQRYHAAGRAKTAEGAGASAVERMVNDFLATDINPGYLLLSSFCSGLMYPDTNLGENARHGEVFDEQAKTYIFP